MRVLIANYRYFVSGGPERYMFNVSAALQSQEHEVVPFSIRYARNRPSPYDRYFVSPLAGPDAVALRQHRWTPRAVVKTLERAFYSPEVERAVARLIEDTAPDVAYVLHFLTKLSPSLLVGIKRLGVPLVVRLQDFGLLCPQSHFLRGGQPCTLCRRGDLRPSVRYRCVSGSLAASVVSYLARLYHRRRGFYGLVDRFVVTNEFMRQTMVEAGWPAAKLALIPTFAPEASFAEPPAAKDAREPFVLFNGQLEEHKGPELLLRAYALARRASGGSVPRLMIAARAEGPCAERCRALVRDLGLDGEVSFLGFVDEDAMRCLYRRALFTAVPSLWFENLPNALIESYAAGTPVIGSGHGSIAPFIEEGTTGYTFAPGDAAALADVMRRAWSDLPWCREAGRQAQERARVLFSAERHLADLLALFREVQSTGGGRSSERGRRSWG